MAATVEVHWREGGVGSGGGNSGSAYRLLEHDVLIFRLGLILFRHNDGSIIAKICKIKEIERWGGWNVN